ncbi:cupin domain-containing protein [Streptomyces sp. A7024]|uniref:Cupin domain-containing protein n=1 Tax=Streptomyces coryli TaxID=1128680 RepID=A0A6G4U4U6_9ACTN|nr:cupin domain-containing protein [Streptomyces coryli]NGN66307.1 cupin domain-containing protein [Streptomyces coryli]
MSYPEPRYHKAQGEVNAVFRPVGAKPEIQSGGGHTKYLATHETTGGEFGLYEVEMAPGSPGPSTHFHRTISESFYVLDGEVGLYDGDKWITATAGDFLYVPVGGLHAFRNDSADDPARMLLLFAPGAPREEYFEQVAEMSRRGGQELEDFRIRHDSYFVDEPKE